VGDTPTLAYYFDDGSLVATCAWRPVASAGRYFFYSHLEIGATPLARTQGKYTVKVNWNGAFLGATSFWMQEPGLSVDQKIFDFDVLASLYAKRYRFQDNRRGKLFGWRTAGAGGAASSQELGFYAESGTATVTITQQCRRQPIPSPDYPATVNVEYKAFSMP
jgi:hypothetical protein